jgi:hypothetical protein
MKNYYPIPKIDDLLNQCKGAKLFSKIDIESTYYLAPIKTTNVWKILVPIKTTNMWKILVHVIAQFVARIKG